MTPRQFSLLRQDPEAAAYFASLPPRVQAFLVKTDAEISTRGELQLIGEHLKETL
ncbi:MAG: hypothetical protein LKE53_06605 [Oscillospiraceae bacterium]|nr:hypothetical protein [Oscillospiraceae bacterium]MDD3260661.1 hypothetical protein [Oscillospiraceae bacterium]